MPGTAVIPATQTTYVDSSQPSRSFPSTPTLLAGFLGGAVFRSLVRAPFPSAAIPAGATVLSATLDLFLTSSEQPAPPTPYAAYRLTSPWTEVGTAWSSQPGFDPVPVATLSFGSEVGLFKSWDVTGLVAAWQSGLLPNFGVMIRSGNETTDNVARFVSRFTPTPALAPRFTVVFEVLPPPPPGVETVATGDTFAGSQVRAVGEFTTYTVWVNNTGGFAAVVRLELGPDGSHFLVDGAETVVAPDQLVALVPYRFAAFARVGYRSAVAGHPTTLEIRINTLE